MAIIVIKTKTIKFKYKGNIEISEMDGLLSIYADDHFTSNDEFYIFSSRTYDYFRWEDIESIKGI